MNKVYKKNIQDKTYSNLILGQIFQSIKNQKNKQTHKEENLKLIIGYDQEKQQEIYVPESGLYQNFLITGTIGTGKTSSAMYPFTRTTIKIQF